MFDYRKLIEKQKSFIVKTRRDLHRIPEPAFTEKKTSAYVADILKQEGLKVETGIAQYGVVGLLEMAQPGKTLLLRADMDALPIQEETGLDFASIHKGAMHACGHDGHITMVLTAAKILNQMKSELKGTI